MLSKVQTSIIQAKSSTAKHHQLRTLVLDPLAVLRLNNRLFIYDSNLMQKTFQWFFDKIIFCNFFQCSHERNCILWKWYETFFEVRGRSSSEVTLKFPSIQLLTLLDFLLFYRCPLISITEPLYLFCLILFYTSLGWLLDGFKNWIKMNPPLQ